MHFKYGKIDAEQVVLTSEAKASGGEKELKGYYPTVSLNKNGRVLVILI